MVYEWFYTQSPTKLADRSSDFSPSSESYRNSAAIDPVHATISSPGELPITKALITAFCSSLKVYGVTLRFFSGSWGSFDMEHSGGRYNVVLTSETIYKTESLSPLIALMRGSCGYGGSTNEEGQSPCMEPSIFPSSRYLCLVAAKVLYFGVGGGVSEFTRAVESLGRGRVKTVWKREVGVGRRIMQVEWLV